MRVPMTISIELELKQDVERMCQIIGIPTSKLVCQVIHGLVASAKSTGLYRKEKATLADLVRMFGEGAKLNPLA